MECLPHLATCPYWLGSRDTRTVLTAGKLKFGVSGDCELPRFFHDPETVLKHQVV